MSYAKRDRDGESLSITLFGKRTWERSSKLSRMKRESALKKSGSKLEQAKWYRVS